MTIHRVIIMNKVVYILFLLLGFTSSVHAAQTDTQGWPRTFQNADGTTTELLQKPQKILSTAVSVTGTLLAIDTPVIASSTASDGRFFRQWEALAKERKVQELWAAGAVDTEMVYSVMPDLIVVSITGADSVLEQVAELQLLAPVIIVDYGGQTWQKLAEKLAFATGRETFTKQKIAKFDQKVKNLKLSLKDKKANIISYNGAAIINSIAKKTAPHSELIHSLGFEIEGAENEWEILNKQRNDFARVHYETLTRLKAPITFLISADKNKVQKMLADPVLANLPSVQKKQVYPLGENSFRIDYFSSLEIIELMKQHFSQVK